MRTDLTQENLDAYVRWWNRKKGRDVKSVVGRDGPDVPIS